MFGGTEFMNNSQHTKRAFTQMIVFVALLATLSSCRKNNDSSASLTSEDVTVSSNPQSITSEDVSVSTDPQSISFGVEELEVVTGNNVQLNPSILPAREYEDLVIEYTSSNPDVATVSDTGYVTSYKEGTSTIKAVIEQYSLEASLELHVYDQYVSDYVFNTKNDEHQYQEATLKDFPTFTHNANEVNIIKGVYKYTESLVYELTETGDSYRVCGIDANTFTGNDVFIPEEYNGLPVTEIKNEAFAYKWYLFNVYIPKTINKIGLGAFSSSGIVNLYYDAEEIVDFYGSNWVFYPQNEKDFAPEQMKQDIHLLVGPNVKCIPSRFFFPLGTHTGLHPKVSSIEFCKDSKVTSIGEYAFYNLEDIQTVYLPSSLKTIGEYAFYNMGIKELKLPDSVTTIGKNAFTFCDSLKNLKLSKNLEFVSESAFYGCEKLEYLDFSQTKLKTISKHSFKNCSSLTYLNLSGVEQIEESAFENDEALLDLSIADTVKHIGLKAFMGCESVKSLYLGNSVEVINEYAFKDLTNLEQLFVASNDLADLVSGNNVFTNLGNNYEKGIDVIYQTGVEKIVSRMFFPHSDASNVIHIHRLFLPTSMKEIKEFALYGATVDSIRYQGKESNYQVSAEEHNNELPKPVYMEDIDYVD